MRATKFLSELMTEAWGFVRRNGATKSEALKTAWLNAKLKLEMDIRIVRFYFQKVDGCVREAFGTLRPSRIPVTAGTDNRKKNATVKTYFDTEKNEWRCFKKMNLIKIA